MRVIYAGISYFLLVFGAGFILGTLRTFWVVPRMGSRWAELIEAPIMLGVVVGAARWIVRILGVPSTPPDRLGMGFTALGLLVLAEGALILRLRHMSIRTYFSRRDPVAATVYFALLAVFALLPVFI